MPNAAKEHTQEYKDAAIQTIARDLLGIETLEERKRDNLDFHDVSVWQVRRALDARQTG